MPLQKLVYLTAASLVLLCFSACKPPPPVNDSRDIVWGQFSNKSIDTLLLAWGAPQAETKLTDGSRLVTYRHSTEYDGGSSNCEVSFLAHVPNFSIDNIAMKGDAYECSLLAQGKTGTTRRNIYMQPPTPFYPYR